jgi:hypothetical protein
MTNEKDVFMLSPKGFAFTGQSVYTLSLTAEEVAMLAAAMESYSNETYSTDEDYDSRPLENLRAKVDELASRLPPQV